MSLIDLERTRVRVEAYLKSNVALRDNDLRLMVNLWKDEIPWKTMTGEDVLRAIAKGEVTPPETIRRSRQLLQEKFPELRGERYGERKELAKEETRAVRELSNNPIVRSLQETGEAKFEGGSLKVQS